MATILSKPTFKVNNQTWPIKPNTLKFTEGEGETEVMTQSSGGASVEVVTADSAESKLSMVTVEILPTEANIKRARDAKKNPGNNVLEFFEGDVKRVVGSASITNDYEVVFSTTGTLSLEWKGAQSI